MFNKKGSLSIRYIVLFALALIVLVVIAVIFYGGTSDFAVKIKEMLNGFWSVKPQIKPLIKP